MASVAVNAAAPQAADWPLAHPWTWMFAALAATASAFVWVQLLGSDTEGGRLALIGIGLLALGISLWLGFGSAAGTSRALPTKLERFLAGVLALGALLWGGWHVWRLLVDTTEFFQWFFRMDTFGVGQAQGSRTGSEYFFHLVNGPVGIWLTAVFAAAAFRDTGWTARDRGSALLGGAVLATWMAVWALYLGPERADEWFSMRLLLAMVSAVAMLAVALYALPVEWRRAGVSALAVLHFAGIGTAALGAPPQPWIINQLWVRFYRPYLEFMYLNNAYRYYSPEPGPPTLLWFRVEYEEGKQIHTNWIYVPDMDTETGRHRHPMGLVYQRRLSLTQNTEPSETPPLTARDEHGVQRMNPAYQARLRHAPQDFVAPIPLGQIAPASAENRLIVPFHPDIRPETQLLVPNFFPKDLLRSCAKYAMSLPHPTHPAAKAKTVKVYRVVHQIMLPRAYAGGMHPTDLVFYLPYYMGEYDQTGELTEASKRDPFLYWLLPNLRDNPNDLEHSKLRCYYLRHAGERDWILWPDKTWHSE
jgi:hypothetical protein